MTLDPPISERAANAQSVEDQPGGPGKRIGGLGAGFSRGSAQGWKQSGAASRQGGLGLTKLRLGNADIEIATAQLGLQGVQLGVVIERPPRAPIQMSGRFGGFPVLGFLESRRRVVFRTDIIRPQLAGTEQEREYHNAQLPPARMGMGIGETGFRGAERRHGKGLQSVTRIGLLGTTQRR